ncbi:MAG TPA: YcnI family protein [Streptosporangiaceae bacterium]|nr:YcnI family protein [Streptosporangiaceae bacterium]
MSTAFSPLKLVPGARTLRRATVVSAAATAMLLLAGPAFAHITVTPDSVPAGSADVLTFHVPNEEANASTVKVDVQIPVDHPVAQLLVQPVPGWTVSVKTVKLAKPLVTGDGSFSQAVSEVIWSGGRIVPGQFQSFTISADPMPAGESQVPFKAIQTYSNGDVVRWIDLQQPGLPAPAHPAPVVKLSTAMAPAGAVHAGTAPASSGSGGGSSALGLAGLVVGLLACLLALMVARQNRRLAAGSGVRAGSPAAAGAPAATVQAGPASEPGGEWVLASTRAPARRDQAPAGSKAPTRRPAPANKKASSRQPQRRRRG